MKQGKDIALVSDSGTPGISDPGFLIIKDCINNSIPIVPIPGPTAFISALICSGLPTDKFGFYGFLPKKDKKKREVRSRRAAKLAAKGSSTLKGKTAVVDGIIARGKRYKNK